MTKLKIKAGNKLIAEFMDVIWKDDSRNGSFYVGNVPRPFSPILSYHISWDWLMSVREEIEYMGFRFSLFSCEEHCVVEFTDMTIPGKSIVKIKSYNYNNIIEVVYEAIIKFIKWYNDNPNKSLNHE